MPRGRNSRKLKDRRNVGERGFELEVFLAAHFMRPKNPVAALALGGSHGSHPKMTPGRVESHDLRGKGRVCSARYRNSQRSGERGELSALYRLGSQFVWLWRRQLRGRVFHRIFPDLDGSIVGHWPVRDQRCRHEFINTPIRSRGSPLRFRPLLILERATSRPMLAQGNPRSTMPAPAIVLCRMILA